MRRARLPPSSSGNARLTTSWGVSRAASNEASGFGRCPATPMPATSTARPRRAATSVRLCSSALANADCRVRGTGGGAWGACSAVSAAISIAALKEAKDTRGLYSRFDGACHWRTER